MSSRIGRWVLAVLAALSLLAAGWALCFPEVERVVTYQTLRFSGGTQPPEGSRNPKSKRSAKTDWDVPVATVETRYAYLGVARVVAGGPFFATCAVAPVTWCIIVVWERVAAGRRRRRTTAGLCPACSYDLRATPDRCPECGWTRAGEAGAG